MQARLGKMGRYLSSSFWSIGTFECASLLAMLAKWGRKDRAKQHGLALYELGWVASRIACNSVLGLAVGIGHIQIDPSEHRSSWMHFGAK